MLLTVLTMLAKETREFDRALYFSSNFPAHVPARGRGYKYAEAI